MVIVHAGSVEGASRRALPLRRHLPALSLRAEMEPKNYTCCARL